MLMVHHLNRAAQRTNKNENGAMDNNLSDEEPGGDQDRRNPMRATTVIGMRTGRMKMMIVLHLRVGDEDSDRADKMYRMLTFGLCNILHHKQQPEPPVWRVRALSFPHKLAQVKVGDDGVGGSLSQACAEMRGNTLRTTRRTNDASVNVVPT